MAAKTERKNCEFESDSPNHAETGFAVADQTQKTVPPLPRSRTQVSELVAEYVHFYNYERINLKNGLTPDEIRSKAA